MDPQIITTVESIDPVFYYIFGISVFLLVGITATMIYFAVKYNRKIHPEPASKVSGNILLEVTWTVIPTFIALSMFYFGWAGYLALHNVPENAMDVKVTGRMWSWTFEYENGRISDRLFVPVNQPVRVRIHSEDVLHSFYIPAFRVKKDAVPGMETFVWFVAPETGSYDVFCAEYCGLLHASMITTVEVMPEDEFLAWYEEAPADDIEQQGRELLARYGCLGCHSLDGTPGAGPTFQGLYGREVTVAVNGRVETLTADEDYIRESILDPNARIVQGFPPIMPSYRGQIPEGELDIMVAFLSGTAGQEQPQADAAADVDIDALLAGKGCIGCHSTDGSPRAGPTFLGLYGRETTVLRNGEEVMVTADEEYIRNSILNPQELIVKGYPPIMPANPDLSEEELSALVEYLKGLGK